MAQSQRYRDAKWQRDLETGRFDQEVVGVVRQMSVPTPLMALGHMLSRRLRPELDFSLGSTLALVLMLAPKYRGPVMERLKGIARISVDNAVMVEDRVFAEVMADFDQACAKVSREEAKRDADRERARRVEEGLRQTEHTRDGEGDEDDE